MDIIIIELSVDIFFLNVFFPPLIKHMIKCKNCPNLYGKLASLMFLMWIKCTIFTPAMFIMYAKYLVNSDTTAFLKNYQHQRSVKTAFSNLELDHLQRHLQVELQRQTKIASTSKQQCEVQMRRAIQEFTEVWTPPDVIQTISILLCLHSTVKYGVFNNPITFGP